VGRVVSFFTTETRRTTEIPQRDKGLRTTKPKILALLERIFSRVLLGAHASGVHAVAIELLLHAGSVGSQESGTPPPLCGEFFWLRLCRSVGLRVLRVSVVNFCAPND
jgi:hypothetical protein